MTLIEKETAKAYRELAQMNADESISCSISVISAYQ
jgi:hypothetical protein